MNIVIGDKVVMYNEFERLNLIGEEFEVSAITNHLVILCDNKGKGVCSVDVDNFDKYFKKPEYVDGWTKWSCLFTPDGDIFAFYRSRPSKGKVEVKLADGEVMLNKSHGPRCSATCSRGDVFNLEFGIRLALQRCYKKHYEKNLKIMNDSAEYYKSLMTDNKNKVNEMIADWCGEYVKEHDK